MNKVVLIGRLTALPDLRYSQGENPLAICRYRLAVDRKFANDGEQQADFIPCIVFGKQAEFAEKYFGKGTKIAITGKIQTGSYTNKDGQKVYTTDVVVEEQEFCEKKSEADKMRDAAEKEAAAGVSPYGASTNPDGFMNIPDGIDEELPFN